MADATIGVLESTDPAAKKVDNDSLTVGADTVYRQRVRLAGASAADLATVVSGRLSVDGSGVTQPVSAASLPLPAGAAQEHATAASPHAARLSDGAAFYDAAKTGQLPAALIGGRLDVNVGNTPSVTVTGAVDTELTTADLDTGAGTDTRAVVGLALAAPGGAVLAGAANPLPVTDNGGSLTVDGTVTANAGSGPWPVTDNGGSLTVDDGGGSITVDGTVSVSGTTTVDTELPAAATLTDAAANPTTPTVGTANLVYNGATWDRARGDTTNGLDVDVTRLPSGTVAGAASLPAGTNNIGDVDVLTLPAIPAGSNLIGRVNLDAQTGNGLTPHKKISAASTNATSLKASAGNVHGIYAHNTNASPRYLKLYDKASAPTVGTDTPVLTLPIPGNTAGAGFVLPLSALGVTFTNGIAYALTTGVADSDTAAVAANEIVVNILYK